MFMGMLEFAKFNGKWDIKIEGLGISAMVSEVQNTLLKSAKPNLLSPLLPARPAQVHHGCQRKNFRDGVIGLLKGQPLTTTPTRLHTLSRLQHDSCSTPAQRIGQPRAKVRGE